MLFTKTPAKSESDEIVRHLLGGAGVSQFASVLLAEIAEAASEDQLRAFFGAVGRRIAALQPAEGIRKLDAMVDNVNALWTRLGWGQAEFELDDDGIDIHHVGLPASLDGDDTAIWARTAPFVLEGAYDMWFRQMGSTARLRTSILRSEGGLVELRHGL